jgi:shikimate kinase
MTIVLIGLRGSGKSTIGRRLADNLWIKFVDLDEHIIQQAGQTIREIFESHGEVEFRDMETISLGEVLSATADQVIALGGGAPLREENRQLIAASGAKVIYLRCQATELNRRIQADPQTQANRPHLTPYAGGVKEIEHLLAIREPIYRDCMTAELDVTNLTPQDAAVYIVRML